MSKNEDYKSPTHSGSYKNVATGNRKPAEKALRSPTNPCYAEYVQAKKAYAKAARRLDKMRRNRQTDRDAKTRKELSAEGVEENPGPPKKAKGKQSRNTGTCTAMLRDDTHPSEKCGNPACPYKKHENCPKAVHVTKGGVTTPCSLAFVKTSDGRRPVCRHNTMSEARSDELEAYAMPVPVTPTAPPLSLLGDESPPSTSQPPSTGPLDVQQEHAQSPSPPPAPSPPPMPDSHRVSKIPLAMQGTLYGVGAHLAVLRVIRPHPKPKPIVSRSDLQAALQLLKPMAAAVHPPCGRENDPEWRRDHPITLNDVETPWAPWEYKRRVDPPARIYHQVIDGFRLGRPSTLLERFTKQLFSMLPSALVSTSIQSEVRNHKPAANDERPAFQRTATLARPTQGPGANQSEDFVPAGAAVNTAEDPCCYTVGKATVTKRANKWWTIACASTAACTGLACCAARTIMSAVLHTRVAPYVPRPIAALAVSAWTPILAGVSIGLVHEAIKRAVHKDVLYYIPSWVAQLVSVNKNKTAIVDNGMIQINRESTLNVANRDYATYLKGSVEMATLSLQGFQVAPPRGWGLD